MTADFGATGAAVLYTAGVATLFGVRSWQHRRVTGGTGFNVARSPSVSARVAAGYFAVALGAGLASPVLARMHLVPLLGRGEHWTAGPLGWLGMGLALTGFGLAVAAQQAMGESWRIGVDPTERTRLVTDGVFAVVRNPIFTAMITAQIGTALMAPTWISAAGAAALIAGCQLQVRAVEEPYLAWVHRYDYLDYATRAGRFLPWIGRLPDPARGPVPVWRPKAGPQ